MGEDLVLESKPRGAGIDRTLTRANLEKDVTERLEHGIAHANFVINNSPLPKREGWERELDRGGDA